MLTKETKQIGEGTFLRWENGDGSLGGWVSDKAHVDPYVTLGADVVIYNRARLLDHASVLGNAAVCSDAVISRNATVCDNAIISGNAQISGSVHIYGNAHVRDNAIIKGSVSVCDDALVADNASVSGSSRIRHNAMVYGQATCHDTDLEGRCKIFGDAIIKGIFYIGGQTFVTGGLWTSKPLHIIGSRHPVTNCAPGYISIGCIIEPFEYWLENYEQEGFNNSYGPDEITEYKNIIDFVIANGR